MRTSMEREDRHFTQLHLDVAFGRAGGRIIWQPRILAWLTDKAFEGRPYTWNVAT